MCGCTSSARCTVCKILGILATLVLTLTTVAALVGVYRTHVLPGGMSFGTPEGSLALLVLVLSAAIWVKMVWKMCPCPSLKGCGGCGPCSCPPGHCTCGK